MFNLLINGSSDDFDRKLEQFDVVPVHAIVNSATTSPIEAYRVLGLSGDPSFIFESESPEKGASRYAYVCSKVDSVLRTGDDEPIGDVDPVAELRNLLESRTVAPLESLPSLASGAFGFVAYEAIKHFEPSVGELPIDPTGSPQSAFVIPRELLIFDRELNQLHILVFEDKSGSFSFATERIHQIFKVLDAPMGGAAANEVPITSHSTPSNKTDFHGMVQAARKAITEGELIQVVLGQRFETRTNAEPVDIYEQLSSNNPSPYMYLLDLGDMQLIGASPELMLRSIDGVASIHPIAGTKPRGLTAEEDLQNEADLISNEKESAEHVMLVDLARNDLGRVCRPGSVKVTSLKHIERYSHVMHLVSRVEGEFVETKDGIDAFQAGFPIGTLSGAPKIRSIQMIAELEPEGRGPYCGAIGWFGSNGDIDTGTIIRSIVLKNGTAHVQGGAGIVFDSDPEAENLESIQKTKAPLLAIARAEAMRELRWRTEKQSPTETSQPATMLLSGD